MGVFFVFFRRSKTEYPQMNGEMEATTQDQGGFFAKVFLNRVDM